MNGNRRSGSMRNVAAQFAQTVMRADGLQQVLGGEDSWRMQKVLVEAVNRPNDTGCHQVPHLPRQTTLDVTKCHTCDTNSRQARHESQPSAISPTPATRSEDRCRQVPHLPHKEGRCRQAPRLPHKVKADVAKCHTCHTK